MKKIFAVILFALLGSIFCHGAEYITEYNLPYREAAANEYAAERCKLDVYYSPGMTDRPVVVWFHGGGLTGGEKFIPEELKNDSIVVVAVNYRLLPKADIAETIDDAAASVNWVFNNIERFGGSTDKIFLAGHSAGGYLISMIGLDKEWLANYGIDADNVAALFPYSGQVLTHFAVREASGLTPLDPLIDRYAPMAHARKDAPPYIIISGDREEELFGRYEENAYMWRLMKMKGHPETYIYELQGYDHGAMAEPAHHILKNHIRRILSAEK